MSAAVEHRNGISLVRDPLGEMRRLLEALLGGNLEEARRIVEGEAERDRACASRELREAQGQNVQG